MADPLETYRRKRDFARTPEPPGEVASRTARRGSWCSGTGPAGCTTTCGFEIDGVLVSWAVPKGPTLDPAVRRLAVHVEDHPIEYLHFEGVIPAGRVRRRGRHRLGHRHLGAGPRPTTRAPRSRRASCTPRCTASKLRGRLVLVRRDATAGDGGEPWMLLHKRDEHAVEGWDPEDHPRSVLSRPHQRRGARRPAPALALRRRPPPRPSVSLLPDPLPDEAIDELAALGKQGTWEVFGRQAQGHQPRQGAVPRATRR